MVSEISERGNSSYVPFFPGTILSEICWGGTYERDPLNNRRNWSYWSPNRNRRQPCTSLTSASDLIKWRLRLPHMPGLTLLSTPLKANLIIEIDPFSFLSRREVFQTTYYPPSTSRNKWPILVWAYVLLSGSKNNHKYK